MSTVKAEKVVKFKIQRFDPSKDEKPYFIEYEVPIVKGTTILDALIYIKQNLDSTLSMRYSCRMGICGSCAMIINGIPRLACETQVLQLGEDVVEIQPLSSFPHVRDLITDFKTFFAKHKKVKSFLIRKDVKEQFNPKAEYLQPKEKLKEILPYTRCITCGVCYASCPVIIKNEGFLGPEALAKAYRYISDSRDEGVEKRIPTLEEYPHGCWSCTTCSTCKLNCPKEVSGVDSVINIRSIMTEKGKIQPTLRDALESMYLHGNPWGRIRDKRSAWIQDQNLSIKDFSKGEKAELCWFVGCTPAYDPRVQQVAGALARILQKANTNFAVLGNEESCCGNEAYNVGEMGLFDELKEANLKLFEKYNIGRVITTSPHCYNAFRSRYGKISFEVQHYTQYLAELIEKGKLKFSRKVEKVVTYHDPCYLGKINEVYEAPRKVIESIPGVKFKELPRSRRMSLCCEGGGGLMWMDVPTPRLGEFRVKEAIEVGAEVILVSCPFCMINLEDAVKTTGNEDKIKVLDVAEFLLEEI
ncbi:MAG: succinate dehydrogenase iron-sulfur subunit [Candidatus Bathyarchaeota archaeon]